MVDKITGSDPIIDGRTARRNRNRDAVLDAMITLARETDQEPAIEEIAAQAQVSYRSVYRYFDDRTDLTLAAIGRAMGEAWSVFDVADLGEGTLDERIPRFIEPRVAAYRKLAPLSRIMTRRSATESVAMEHYDNVRAFLRDQLEMQFAPELAAAGRRERTLVIAALDVMFQFEALDFLGQHDGMTDGAMSKVLERHVRAHLAAIQLSTTR